MIYPQNFEQKIGFDQIRQLLKDKCLSTLGEERVNEMNFSDHFEEVDELLNQVAEFVRIIQEEDNFPDQFFVHAVLSLVADKRTFGRLLFLGDCVAAFQPLRLYSCFDAAEGYHGILPVDFKYFSDRTLSFDTYRTPFGDGSRFGSLLNCRLLFGAVLLSLLQKIKELVCIIGIKINVNISMQAGLLSVQDIHSPASIQPKLHVQAFQQVQNLK
jgi:hypothetical protein